MNLLVVLAKFIKKRRKYQPLWVKLADIFHKSLMIRLLYLKGLSQRIKMTKSGNLSIRELLEVCHLLPLQHKKQESKMQFKNGSKLLNLKEINTLILKTI